MTQCNKHRILQCNRHCKTGRCLNADGRNGRTYVRRVPTWMHVLTSGDARVGSTHSHRNRGAVERSTFAALGPNPVIHRQATPCDGWPAVVCAGWAADHRAYEAARQEGRS